MSTKKKQERFAYKIILELAPTPNPSFSSSTVPSSAGLINSPSMTQDILEPPPYHSIPPPYPGQVRPHHYLEPNAVDWDMMDHPSVMSRNDIDNSISSGALDEPAIDIPLPYIPITSPHLPWTIKVRASNGSYITLEDLYSAVYRTLRTNITANEFSTLTSESDRRRATRAYEQRYRRKSSGQAYEEEKRGGMKRIDFLMGRTRFLGIANNNSRPDEWQLIVT